MGSIEAIKVIIRPKEDLTEYKITSVIEDINKELQKLGKLEITLIYK